jgi:hypothetical protein
VAFKALRLEEILLEWAGKGIMTKFHGTADCRDHGNEERSIK